MIGDRADVGEGLWVGDLPALRDVRLAVGPVGGEQGGRMALLSLRVFAEEVGVHDGLLASNFAVLARPS
jgi:hypothetical protein